MDKDVHPYRIALLGVGRIGVMHARLLAKHPLVGELILADAFEERARSAADDLGVRTAPVDEVTDPSNPLGLQGLIIATGTATHADLLIKACKIGIPTYCEKPIALDLDQGRIAADAINQAKLPHAIGFQRRFDVGYNRAKKLLEDGELGELRRFHGMTCDQFPPADEFIPGSGGIFVDCNSHDFDIIRWLTGQEVVEVYATGSTRGSKAFAESTDYSDSIVTLTLADGTVGSLHSSRYNGQGHEVRLDLMGTEGSANVGLDNKVPFRSVEANVAFPPEEPWYDFIERFLPCYERELDHFLRNPMVGKPGACTVDDAMAALKIALSCNKSRDEHRPVRVDEVG